VSNRPIAKAVQKALAAAAAGTPVPKLDRETKTAHSAFLKAAGVNASELTYFAGLVDCGVIRNLGMLRHGASPAARAASRFFWIAMHPSG